MPAEEEGSEREERPAEEKKPEKKEGIFGRLKKLFGG
jgi:hypothetical protein